MKLVGRSVSSQSKMMKVSLGEEFQISLSPACCFKQLRGLWLVDQ